MLFMQETTMKEEACKYFPYNPFLPLSRWNFCVIDSIRRHGGISARYSRQWRKLDTIALESALSLSMFSLDINRQVDLIKIYGPSLHN
jgi:hypothetical protein